MKNKSKNKKVEKVINVTQNIKIPDNTEFFKKHFSHCFDKSGNFDFEKFKKELSQNEDIDFSKESYGMDWLGKSYARLLASDEATTLLKEDEEFNQKTENKDSQNLLIKGDNLEILKHLSNAYYEKVKMIYIDPPYNTGSDGFVYEDDRKFTAEEISKLAGVDEEKAKRILDFTQSKSNSHSAWLTFMYPRLYIAKQLLKDDGVIFISIDDNEVAQLKLLMDDIFGEENFVALVSRVAKRTSDKGTHFRPTKDYVLVYVKNKTELDEFGIVKICNPSDYKLKDDDGRQYKKSGASLYQPSLDSRPNQRYYIEAPDGSLMIPPGNIFPDSAIDGAKVKPQSNSDKVWRWSVETYKLNKHKLIFTKGSSKNPLIDQNGKQSKWNIYPKTYLDEDERATLHPEDIIYDYPNSQGTKELLAIKIPFSFSKPSNLIKYLIKIIQANKDIIILDFFAGSGTTADAVMQLNAEDNGNRKFILAQLPEEIDAKNNKTDYDFVKDELKIKNPTIFEITKERIIRSAKKIQKDNIDKPAKSEKIKCEGCGGDEEHCPACKGDYNVKIEATKKKDLSKQDFGFKIFETTPIWEDYNFDSEEFDPQTKLFNESKLTDKDLKILLTTWKTYDGISLAKDLEGIDLDGYTGHYFDNKLYLMDKGFKTKNLKKLLTEIDENKDFNPATVIVFGYNFESKVLREIAENIKSYANKKHIDVDFVTRY